MNFYKDVRLEGNQGKFFSRFPSKVLHYYFCFFFGGGGGGGVMGVKGDRAKSNCLRG